MPPALALALLALVAGGYFYGGAAWNQSARLDAVYAFVEPGHPETGSFRIDRFLYDPDRNRNTGDWSLHDGHYYANKAPGTILLGVLPYAALVLVESALGLSLDAFWVASLNAYVLNVLLSVVPVAVGLVGFDWLLRRRGCAPPRAFVLSLGLFFATPLFPYTTMLFGHTLAAACLIGALVGVEHGSPRALFAAGLAAGVGVITDYLLAPFAALLTLWQLVRRRREAWPLIAGGAGPALAMLGYHALCFGSPLALPTDSTNPQFLEADRALGMFGAPSSTALWQLTLGTYRGLFLGSPWLLLAVPGCLYARRQGVRPDELAFWLAACLAHLLLVAGFLGWDGGATVSPRYLIPSLPLVVLCLAWVPATSRWRSALVALGAVSALNMFAIAAVSPLVPDGTRNPLFGLTWDLLSRGHLSPYPLPIRLQALNPAWEGLAPWSAWNLGELLGLRGRASLLPLLPLLAALGVYGWRGACDTTRYTPTPTEEDP